MDHRFTLENKPFLFSPVVHPVALSLLGFLLFFSACRPTKFLAPGERLVVSNTVKLKKSEKIKDETNLKYDLFTLIRPSTNARLFGLFRTRLWYHYKTSSPSDTTKFDRWLRRVVAEPPALYDSLLVEASVDNISNFLKNRGYWDVEVIPEIKNKGNKKVALTYIVRPGPGHYLDELGYQSSDSRIRQILQQTRKEARLKKGSPIESRLYNEEVQRITQTLRDSGYAYFYSNYIDQLELDTSGNRIQGRIRIFPYRDSIGHPRFRIGRINVYPDYRAGQESFISYQKRENDINFLSEDGDFSTSTELLESNIFFKPGSLYQQSKLSKTNRKLGEMDIYRFISIEPVQDTLDPSILNFDIRLIPKDRWVIGYDAELNTFANSQSNALIGGSFSLNLRNRNLLKGAELFNINSALGIEFSRRLDQQIISTLDGRVEMSLSIPKYSDPLKFYRLLNRVRLISDKTFSDFQEDARTAFSVSYNYVSLIDFYQYSQINTSFGYEFRPGSRVTLAINHLGIDYLAATAQDTFQLILSRNPFLRNSFESEQFFTGILFRDITHTWRKDHLATGDSWLIRNGLELSGWEAYAGNALVNLFRDSPNEKLAISGVPLSLYGRYEFDGRYYKTYNPQYSLAFRLNAAIAIPYGQTSEVPYVKQYFVGGPTSLRAWRIREVGPGGYADPIIFDPENTQVFYQTGDFKLEFNAEYRFDLFKFYAQVEGALFVDIGNVWTLREDSARAGSQLQWKREVDENGQIVQDNFLNQLAVGTGFGIRADFSYFLIRLDLGYPVRNFFPKADEPYRNSYWVHHRLSDLSLARINYNLAIGYPF